MTFDVESGIKTKSIQSDRGKDLYKISSTPGE